MRELSPTVHVTLRQNHMATTFELCVSCVQADAARAERALSECLREVGELELELSEFHPDSPVFYLNQAEPMKPVAIPGSVKELLARGERLGVETEGSFNMLAKSVSGSPGIKWDECNAWRLDAGAHLSFGAIGKGYALDRVRTRLELAGFRDYLLSAGGSSIVMSGFAAHGEPWTWGWSWQKSDRGESLGIPLTHPSGQAIAMGVSGTHEKGAHLIGATESDSMPLSALVAQGSAADADALSTALFVSGWERGLRWASARSSAPALAVIGADRVPRWNGIFQKLWGALTLAVVTFASTASARADDTLDLGATAPSFTPYINERNLAWIALPVFAALAILIHLKKYRQPRKPKHRSLIP